MYIRKKTRFKDGKRHDYWALVESYRTELGPRQRTVAWIGELDKAGRLGIEKVAKGNPHCQLNLFEEDTEPEWVEVNVKGIRVENIREFGGPWLCFELIRQLGLDQFISEHMVKGREKVPWPLMALVLVICRLCRPSSELHIAEHFFEQTALADLFGIPVNRVNFEDKTHKASKGGEGSCSYSGLFLSLRFVEIP